MIVSKAEASSLQVRCALVLDRPRITIKVKAFFTMMTTEQGTLLEGGFRNRRVGWFGTQPLQAVQAQFDLSSGIYLECDWSKGVKGLQAFYISKGISMPLEVQVEQAQLGNHIKLHMLDKGQYGKVFCMGEKVALKTARGGSDVCTLEEEERLMKAVSAVTSNDLHIKIPFSYGYFSCCEQFESFWAVQDVHHLLQFPLVAMERMPPFPTTLSYWLQLCYYPLSFIAHFQLRRTGRAWRIYMGGLSVPPAKQFFEAPAVYEDRLESLPLDLAKTAHDMGLLLGRIVFRLGFSPNDVEFQVSAGDDRQLRVFCIDFGGFSKHKMNAATVASAICSNDPYISRPSTKYAHDFEGGFLHAAREDVETGGTIFALQILKVMDEIANRRRKNAFIKMLQ